MGLEDDEVEATDAIIRARDIVNNELRQEALNAGQKDLAMFGL